MAAILIGGTPNPDDFMILPDRISKEPLAPLTRRDDDDLFDVVQWTIFALVNAEELGVTSLNVDGMKGSDDPRIRNFWRRPRNVPDLRSAGPVGSFMPSATTAKSTITILVR